MTDQEKSRSWWQTLPGIITGLAATITAVAGLIVAIQQTGWFGPGTSPIVSRPPSSTTSPASGSTSPSVPQKIRLRMMNHDKYDQNFWDQSFRLVVDGVPLAPESGLNELVPGQSAKEGEVMFVIPRGSTGGRLKITYADDSTEIPLDIKSPR